MQVAKALTQAEEQCRLEQGRAAEANVRAAEAEEHEAQVAQHARQVIPHLQRPRHSLYVAK